MLNNLKYVMLITASALIITVCGESETPAPSSSSETALAVTATETPPAITEEPQPALGRVTESADAVMATAPESVPEIAEPEPAPVTPPAETVAPAEPVAETPVADTVATATPATTAPVDGGQIYNTYCAICHKLGMNAAPKYGSKPLWAKRIAQGRETVYTHAINGLRGMPPRGGFSTLSDDEIKAGTDYMVRASGGWGNN
ncbi:MAG: hypothetical protein A2W76_02600 [Gammaproteobacteria bacterium RIFCSPLOWO2_12_47_11]|nr:MAG: hypothetical protein A2W76_02600 [Gammaproteobacteria bacterium RIFCSPLOWO2_12_47_11]